MHDMGQMDDYERSNLIVDKDTQRVYDMRKEMDMAQLHRDRTSMAVAATSGDAMP